MRQPPHEPKKYPYRLPGGGSGTPADPYLTDTTLRFDEILPGLAEGSHIRLGPGVFSTLGLRHSVGPEDFGWEVRSGWIIIGAGADVTILRLARWPDFVASADGPEQCRAWAVVGCSPRAPVSGVVIEKLTVDANWSGLPKRPAPTRTLPATDAPFVALHGIQCAHHGPIAHREVKVIGYYGKSDDRPLEYGEPPLPRSPLADLTQTGAAVWVGEASPPPRPSASNSAPVIAIEHCTFLASGDSGLTSAAI